MNACIGWETRKGLAGNIADRLSPLALYLLVGLLVVANTFNIAADLAAMGEALRLVIGGPGLAYALAFGIACLAAEVFVPYHHYAGYLKISYPRLVCLRCRSLTVQVPWGHGDRFDALVPQVSLTGGFLLMIVAGLRHDN